MMLESCISYFDNCQYPDRSKSAPTIYWINMERSVLRKERMMDTLKLMQFPEKRVKAVDFNAGEVYVPEDVMSSWWMKEYES
jgi:hypothetical protein